MRAFRKKCHQKTADSAESLSVSHSTFNDFLKVIEKFQQKFPCPYPFSSTQDEFG